MSRQQRDAQQRTETMESSLMGMTSLLQATQMAMDFQQQQLRSLEAQQSAQVAAMARQQEVIYCHYYWQ